MKIMLLCDLSFLFKNIQLLKVIFKQQQYDFLKPNFTSDDKILKITFTHAHVVGGVYGTYLTTTTAIMMIIHKQILMIFVVPCSIDCH